MVRKRESFLTQSSAARKQIQLKIDPKLFEDLDKLDKRLKNEAPDRDFDREAVVESALRHAIDAANQELDELRKERGLGTSS